MAEPLDLIIVGGGPAGLCHGFWRKRENPELRLRVIEASPQPGGWLQTTRSEGFSCELGPQGLRPNEDSDALIDALGLADEVVVADASAKLRYLGRGGVLHPLPMGPKDLLRTPILTVGGKLRLLGERFRKGGTRPAETLADFITRRFGPQVVPLAGAMAAGVFAGDAHRLEVDAAFPKLVELEQTHGSILKGAMATGKARRGQPKRPALISFRSGMQTLVQSLRRELGDSLACGRAVTQIETTETGFRVHLDGEAASTLECRKLVLAVPARVAAKLVGNLNPPLANELRAIRFASVANIHLGFWSSDAAEPLRGFGFLLDPAEQQSCLGAIYCSSLFSKVAQEGKFLVRVMAGGSLHPELIEQAKTDPDRVAADAEAMLRRYTGLSGQLLFRRVSIADDAIPQYEGGHVARVERIRAQLRRLPGLSLIGNSYDEVSAVGQMRQ